MRAWGKTMTVEIRDVVTYRAPSTVLATLLAVALVVPANYLGMVAVWFYNFFTNWGLARAGYNGASWIPFMDGLFALLWGVLIPQGIQTFVAVGLSVYGSLRIFRRADPTSVSVSTATLWSIIIALFGLYMISTNGWSIGVLAFVASILGIAIGAAMGRTAILERS